MRPNDPAAVPDCTQAAGLGLNAPRQRSPESGWSPPAPPPVYRRNLRAAVRAASGDYVAWLQGSFGGQVDLFVDGQLVGEARHQLNNEGGFTSWASALGRRRSTRRIALRGADLHPGRWRAPARSRPPALRRPGSRRGTRLRCRPRNGAVRQALGLDRGNRLGRATCGPRRRSRTGWASACGLCRCRGRRWRGAIPTDS